MTRWTRVDTPAVFRARALRQPPLPPLPPRCGWVAESGSLHAGVAGRHATRALRARRRLPLCPARHALRPASSGLVPSVTHRPSHWSLVTGHLRKQAVMPPLALSHAPVSRHQHPRSMLLVFAPTTTVPSSVSVLEGTEPLACAGHPLSIIVVARHKSRNHLSTYCISQHFTRGTVAHI